MKIQATFDIEYQYQTISFHTIEECVNHNRYNDIMILNYINCDLTYLPEFPKRLQTLHCSNNKLTSLPSFPKTLCVINCCENKIIKINEPNFKQSPMGIYYSINGFGFSTNNTNSFISQPYYIYQSIIAKPVINYTKNRKFTEPLKHYYVE